MYENFGNFLLIIFTISKIDFTIKKPILGRKLGNLEGPAKAFFPIAQSLSGCQPVETSPAVSP